MMAAQTKRTKTRLKSMLVRGKTPAKARAVVSPVTTGAKAKTTAKARVAARPTDRKKCRTINPSRSRTNALQPQWVGVECPGPLFFLEKLTCQQILSTDSPILEWE